MEALSQKDQKHLLTSDLPPLSFLFPISEITIILVCYFSIQYVDFVLIFFSMALMSRNFLFFLESFMQWSAHSTFYQHLKFVHLAV